MCKYNGDCSYEYSCIKNICEHNELWPPSVLEVVALLLIPILIGLGNVAGLGGSSITKIPVIMLMLNFSQRNSTYMAYCIQFGSSVTNIILLIFQRHPNKDRPLINYDLVLILTPTVNLGTIIGIYANIFLPELAGNIIFTVFLAIASFFLFSKGRKLLGEEKLQKQIIDPQYGVIQNDQSQNQSSKSNNLIDFDTQKIQNPSYEDNSYQDEYLNQKSLILIYKEEQKKIPPQKFIIIMFFFIMIQLLVFMQGTSKLPSIVGIKICSAMYWVVTSSIPIEIIIFSIIAYKYLSQNENLKETYNYQYDKSDMKINFQNFQKISLAGFMSGFLAGSLGAGGGLCLVTFLLAIGIHPRVVAATSGFNNLQSSLVSVIQVFTNEVLTIYEVLLFMGLAVLGGILIAQNLYKYIQKHNNQSFIIFSVFSLVLINIVCNFIYVFKTAYSQGSSWQTLLEMQQLCK